MKFFLSKYISTFHTLLCQVLCSDSNGDCSIGNIVVIGVLVAGFAGYTYYQRSQGRAVTTNKKVS